MLVNPDGTDVSIAKNGSAVVLRPGFSQKVYVEGYSVDRGVALLNGASRSTGKENQLQD